MLFLNQDYDGGEPVFDEGQIAPEADDLFQNDLTRLQGWLLQAFPACRVNPVRQGVIVNLAYNLSLARIGCAVVRTESPYRGA